MGMFDRVNFQCPSGCHTPIEVQSKAGECCLASIDQREVPIEIAKDIEGEVARCSGCNQLWTVENAPLPMTVYMRLR